MTGHPVCRVLLCSVGLSPQVVTETLHALSERRGWRTDRLIILTTRTGADACRRLLLDPASGALHAYAAEWDAPWARAVAEHTEVVTVDTDSGDLDGERWTTHFSDRALALIGEVCADPETALHVSIAGGRKPAAAILALALALCGRDQDSLSHVLVSDEVESNPGFFYPARKPRLIAVSRGRSIDASTAVTNLIDIPFPRLRHAAPGAAGTFAQAMAEASRTAPPPRLTVDLPGRRILWDGRPLPLPPAQAGWLAWLVAETLGGVVGLPRVAAPRAGYLDHYRAFVAGPGEVARARARLPDPLEPEWMEEKAARIAKLAAACGVQPSGGRLVQRNGPHARALYRLAVPAAELTLIQAKEPPACL